MPNDLSFFISPLEKGRGFLEPSLIYKLFSQSVVPHREPYKLFFSVKNQPPTHSFTPNTAERFYREEGKVGGREEERNGKGGWE